MRREAERLGVAGWVRNLPDGTVEAAIQADDPALAAMLDWCRRGPPLARVDRVERCPDNGVYSGFEKRS